MYLQCFGSVSGRSFVSEHACVRVPGHPQTHSIPHLMISDDVRCAQRATTGMRMLTAMGAYILICRHIRLNVRATYAQAPAQATGRVSIATTNAPLRTRSAAPRGGCRAGRGNSALAFRGIAQDEQRQDERRRAGRSNCSRNHSRKSAAGRQNSGLSDTQS